MATEFGRCAETNAAVNLGIVSNHPNRKARRNNVEITGLPKAACMKATKVLSDGKETTTLAGTAELDSRGGLKGRCQTQSVGSLGL